MDRQVYRPGISALAVLAKTGKDWESWFLLLDEGGAVRMEHKAIVRLLWTRHRLGPWWRQMVAVEYERARGLRLKNQTPTGFSLAVTRTMPAPRAAVFAAASVPGKRPRWFPPGQFKLSSANTGKAIRGAWNAARLDIAFSAGNKTLIAVQLSRLAQEEVERERAAWKMALEKFQAILAR